MIYLFFKGKNGNLYEHNMALLTEALKPKHKYVPWITVNGIHTEEINDEATEDLLKLVCKTYTGELPVECKDKHKEEEEEQKNDVVMIQIV